jgi:translation elongation factor EF-Ts
MPEKVFNPKVKVFLDNILEIAGMNELNSLIDLLDYEMHPDGKSVRDTLEDLSYTIGERLELIDFQVMKVPFVTEKFVTSTLNPVNKSAVGIFYTYKGDGIKAEAIVENIMRDILNYYPLCVKKEQLLPSIVKIEEEKGTLDKFITDKVLLNNKALFEKERRTIEEILKEAQIEVLDFIYI